MNSSTGLNNKCIYVILYISAYADPLNCDLTHMFVHLFKDELNEYLYEADLAGLRMGVSNTANGISVSGNISLDEIYWLDNMNLNSSYLLAATVINSKFYLRKS